MKKFFMTVATVALFAIGFAASDEDESSSNSSDVQTEQKQEQKQEQEQEQESDAEQNASEQKDKKAQLQEMLKDAYEYGKEQGMQFTYYQECNPYFTKRWFTPSTDEEYEIFRKYKREYDRGFAEGHDAKERMNNM